MVGDILQPTHLLFVLIVALLVLGPKRLPEVGRQLGNGLRDFKSAINGESDPRHGEISHEYRQSDAGGDDHEFAHEETAVAVAAPLEQATPGDHEFAGAQTASSETSQEAAAGNEHEFAHETSGPATAPDEPLS